MKELLASRWIEKCQPRDGGKFGGVTFLMRLTVDWKTGDGLTGDGTFTPSNTEYIKTDKPIPPIPKGEQNGFEEIWKAKWSRGIAQHVRVMAAKAYAAALKRGTSHAEVLAAMKSRAGIDKPDTVYAPDHRTALASLHPAFRISGFIPVSLLDTVTAA
jgi:hypothetical protein